ncbi:polysaccharide deacetylase family protein [Algoriphagus sp. D3-2-R+10]|uniref:polysaccharide deacetylase family protein n=1 Tax=Algoriphagus aurantiacus TaxID=3103948 RepID=UPI002B3AA7B0|nr:polysaccharide deacetylase family protein [Algoriphagus sp. D3-2-R+10]MEB2778174.1 polysaccharide deacetylase family protein [Algoriphagus sp. D3-2-R+10]
MIRYIFSILFFILINTTQAQVTIDNYGAIVRSDTSQKTVYLCFTGHDYVEGFDLVLDVLKETNSKGNFFLTGDFVRNHPHLVTKMAKAGHLVGAHSDKHLLYCDWDKRDSLLIRPNEIQKDILENVRELERLGISPKIFMPPYEWYNTEVVEIASELDQTTVNFSPGTRSNADYTTPDMRNYISSMDILTSIYSYESSYGLNGFHLLIHPGTDPLRKDKFYFHLEGLIKELRHRGYGFDTF